MLYLIIGDNKPEISAFLSKIKKDASSKNRTIHEFSKENKSTVNEIKDLVNSSGMFSSEKTIFLSAAKVEDIDFDSKFLEEVKADKETDLIIIDGGINKLTSAYKNVKKHAALKEFSLPRDYSNFNIADAIFIEGNIPKAITLLRQVRDVETEAPAIVAVLYMGLRNYVSVKHNNKTGEKIHPFIKKKMQSSKYNLKDFKKTYLDLAELDVKTKTNSGSKRDLLEDFMLELQ